MAREKLCVSQSKMKTWYDRGTERYEFNPGNQVLALMPIVGSPFQAKYAGPYTIVERVLDLNYVIATSGRRKNKRLCHVNLLKPYYRRVVESDLDQDVKEVVRPALAVLSEVFAQEGDGVPEPDESLLYGRLKNSESLCNLDKLLGHLS